MKLRSRVLYSMLTVAFVISPAAAEERQLAVDGYDRKVLIEPAPRADAPNPALVVLHGGQMSARSMQRKDLVSRILPTALIAYLDGVDSHWNDGRGVTRYKTQRVGIDDVRFLDAVLKLLIDDYAVDPKQIYLVGVSNGGMMTMRYLCERPQAIRAAAAVVSSLPTNLKASCAPQVAPLLLISGTADTLVPFTGGDVIAWRKPAGTVIGVQTTAELFARLANCRSQLPTKQKMGTLGTISAAAWHGCTHQREQGYIALENSGHRWSRRGARTPLLDRLFGPQESSIDMEQVIGTFFSEGRIAIDR